VNVVKVGLVGARGIMEGDNQQFYEKLRREGGRGEGGREGRRDGKRRERTTRKIKRKKHLDKQTEPKKEGRTIIVPM